MKSKLLLGTILLLVLLSACGGENHAGQPVPSDEVPSVTPSTSQPLEDTAGPTEEPSTSGEVIQAGDASPQPTQAPSTSGDAAQGVDSITYANIGYKEDDQFIPRFAGERAFLPISCVYQGEELLKGDFYGDLEGWEYAERVVKTAPGADTLKMVDVKEHMFVGPQRPAYGFDWAATSGDWELFPEKVTYTSYDLEHQPQEQEWIEYFSTLLEEEGLDSPVVILDSWAFQWGGVESVIVTATNVVTCEDGDTYYEGGSKLISRALPSNKAPGIYWFSTLFRPGQEPRNFSYRALHVPLDGDGSYSLAAPPDGEPFSQSISCVQYNESGGLALYPVYCFHVGTETIRNYWYPPEYLLCDRDGDGEVELTHYSRNITSFYDGYGVYKLVDGVPVLDYTKSYYYYIVY